MSLEIVINLLAATETSNIKFIGWPITSQMGVLGGSVMYSSDEFQGWIQSSSSDFQKSLKCFQEGVNGVVAFTVMG